MITTIFLNVNALFNQVVQLCFLSLKSVFYALFYHYVPIILTIYILGK